MVGTAILVIFIVLFVIFSSYLLQHKMRMTLFKVLFTLLALFLITGWYVIQANDIDISDSGGKVEFLNAYLTWCGNTVSGLKDITGNLVNTDWDNLLK